MGPYANSISFLNYKILIIVPASQDLFLVGKIGDGKMGGILETSWHKDQEGRNASRII